MHVAKEHDCGARRAVAEAVLHALMNPVVNVLADFIADLLREILFVILRIHHCSPLVGCFVFSRPLDAVADRFWSRARPATMAPSAENDTNILPSQEKRAP